MKTSQQGISLIKSFENLELKAYKCPASIWTIGYGHTKGVKAGQVITEQQADKFLAEDLADAEKAVNDQGLAFNQNQFDALVSFTFNVGVGAFKRSTLLRKAKADVNDATIRGEFARWDKSNGEVLKGLTRRRASESTLYFSL